MSCFCFIAFISTVYKMNDFTLFTFCTAALFWTNIQSENVYTIHYFQFFFAYFFLSCCNRRMAGLTFVCWGLWRSWGWVVLFSGGTHSVWCCSICWIWSTTPRSCRSFFLSSSAVTRSSSSSASLSSPPSSTAATGLTVSPDAGFSFVSCRQ